MAHDDDYSPSHQRRKEQAAQDAKYESQDQASVVAATAVAACP